MAVYVISYDLNTPGQKYDKLKELIDSFSITWCRPLSSFYIVKSVKSVSEISNLIRTITDDNDHFLVIEVKDNKQGWLSQEQWNHMNSYIF